MSKTVKRVLWQRTLETAGPLRKPLPQAMSQELEAFFCRMQAIVDRGEERRRQQARTRRDRAEFKVFVSGRPVEVRTDWEPIPYGPEFQRCLEVSFDSGGSDDMTGVAAFARGGEHQGGWRLVDEVGPELKLTIPAGGLKVREPLSPSQYDDPLVIAMQYFEHGINEGPKK